MREPAQDAAVRDSKEGQSATAVPAGRIPELDGLRGLAIFMVLICHYFVPVGAEHSWFVRFGYVTHLGTNGVDLFFVLSGFLIGGILLNARNSASYYRSFYVRRFHRIFPVYYFWLLLFGFVAALAPLWGPYWAMKFHVVRPAWVYFLFLQNFSLTPLFYVFTQAYWLSPMWSLAVEEHFYMVMPLLVRRLTLSRLTKLLLALIVISPVLRGIMCKAFPWGPSAALLWTPFRADQLAMGVLLAIFWMEPKAREWIHAHVRFFSRGLALLGAAILLDEFLFAAEVKYTFAPTITFERTLVGLFFLSLIVIVLVRKDGRLATMARWKFLRELGRISYCVYIIHLMMKWVASRLLVHTDPEFKDWHFLGVAALGYFLTWSLAELSWRYIENPLIRRGHRVSSTARVAAQVVRVAGEPGVAGEGGA
jgi:peptidoglycan/LPS O-acetylase OafA/YrhL